MKKNNRMIYFFSIVYCYEYYGGTKENVNDKNNSFNAMCANH